jgi:hypothetical protein
MKEFARILVLAFAGLALLGALPGITLRHTSALAGQQSVRLSVDAIAAGNGANALGPINQTVQGRVGESLEVDVVVQNSQDLLGFGFDFISDQSVVHVSRVNVHMLLASEPDSSVADLTKNLAEPEDTDGTVTPAAADFAQGTAASSEGSGVLARITLVAIGCGTSPLTIRPNPVLGPMLLDSSGELFNPTTSDGAEIVVTAAEGTPCEPPRNAPEAPGAEPGTGLTDDDSSNSANSAASGLDGEVSEGGEAREEAEGGGASPGSTGPQSAATQGPESSKDTSASGLSPEPNAGGAAGTASDGSGSSQPWLWPAVIGGSLASAIAAASVAARTLWRRHR